MERATADGVEVGTEHAGITVSLPHHPGAAARLFRTVASTSASVGAITQHPAGTSATVVFTVPRPWCDAVTSALTAAGYRPAAESLVQVTLTGAALRTDSSIAVIFSEALVMAGVPLTLMCLENHRLSVFCPESLGPAAVHALCEAFEVTPRVTTPARTTAPA